MPIMIVSNVNCERIVMEYQKTSSRWTDDPVKAARIHWKHRTGRNALGGLWSAVDFLQLNDEKELP